MDVSLLLRKKSGRLEKGRDTVEERLKYYPIGADSSACASEINSRTRETRMENFFRFSYCCQSIRKSARAVGHVGLLETNQMSPSSQSLITFSKLRPAQSTLLSPWSILMVFNQTKSNYLLRSDELFLFSRKKKPIVKLNFIR